MNISGHAKARCQQRGISSAHIKLITAFGSFERRPGNATAVYLNKKNLKELERVFRDGMQNIDRLKDQVVLISEDDTVVTCYHQTKKMRKN